MQKYIIVGRSSMAACCTPRSLVFVDALSLDTDETRTKMAVTYEAVRRWRERLNQRRCTTDTFTMDARMSALSASAIRNVSSHVAGLLKENREIVILNSRKPQMHSEDILAPELCQQLRPVRRSSSLRVLATRSRCFTEDDVEYARLRSSRGNLICIIFRGL